MTFQLVHSWWLLALPIGLAWTLYLAWKTDVQVSAWRRWTSTFLRLVIVTAVVLAIAGLQWLRPLEGVNVFFLLDRSESIPPPQQEAARLYVNSASGAKKTEDKAGVIVFGTDAGIEFTPNAAVNLQKIEAVVGTERTDLAAAIRLGTAGFPETGQKRLVLLTDGNENLGDALNAVLAARPLGVTVDVVPLGVARGQDVSVQRLSVPPRLKQGQTFETKIFVQSDSPQKATLRLYRNEQYLVGQEVELAQGKNLFTFPQTLDVPGFYSYSAVLEAPGDLLPQNNRATAFANVRGEPRFLLVSSSPDQDAPLAAAIGSGNVVVSRVPSDGFPGTLAELQSYDVIFISNVAAGELGEDRMRLLESAVRDFGVGLVCIGGDQAYAAGGYRLTPLESMLPVSMELDSKKVLPSGALVLVVHATEFPNGNQWARDIAFAALDALGPQDEMGIVLWDGTDRWLFELQKVGDKKNLQTRISGMNPGDMPSFQNVMNQAHLALQKSGANLKHMVVFSDGDPKEPSAAQMQGIVSDRITVSTVMIGGHVAPDTMMWIADQGRGRFYDVRSPSQLPQIFIKEAAVILKSAIFEEPFKPQVVAMTEPVRGIAAAEYPQLLGYVTTTPKPRAELPLVSDKGDPVLAHWQYGLGRAVAFTSDAKARWGRNWVGWEKYRQFWNQIAQWSMRRLENADFTTDVTVEQGEGLVSVEAVDDQGNYRNFLNLQAVVVSPKGERQMVRLEQAGPGRYEAKFPTKEVGAYMLNLQEWQEGKVRGAQALGTSVNYSPEFSASEPNRFLLTRLAEAGGGRTLNPQSPRDNPFLHDRQRTFQPRDLWEWLLKLAVLLFPLDVGIRRIQIDREEWLRATATLRRWLLFWEGKPRKPEADESLAALLARRERVRASQTAPGRAPTSDLFTPRQPDAQAGVAPKSGTSPVAGTAPAANATTQPETTASARPGEPVSTASRLLEAKRRARKRIE